MSTQTIHYWQSGAWTDDSETAALAIEFLDFPQPAKIELAPDADIQSEIDKLVGVDNPINPSQ